ncbi:MAG: four helix bundle protein [Nitrospiraceae bacterium]
MKVGQKENVPGRTSPFALPERTFEFAQQVVKLCLFLESKPGVSRTLARQLLRSGTSIGANVEEGQASQSEADFLSKYSIACKEARETHYWLRLLAAVKLVDPARLNPITDECNELVAILTSICKKVRGRHA